MSSNPSERIGIDVAPESTLENTVVHDRPTLGSMPGTRRDASLLIRPGADLLCSGLATVFAAVLDAGPR
jgi:hypothetical protein